MVPAQQSMGCVSLAVAWSGLSLLCGPVSLVRNPPLSFELQAQGRPSVHISTFLSTSPHGDGVT